MLEKGQGHQIISTLSLLPIMYLCKYGQNPSTGSEVESTRKADFLVFIRL